LDFYAENVDRTGRLEDQFYGHEIGEPAHELPSQREDKPTFVEKVYKGLFHLGWSPSTGPIS